MKGPDFDIAFRLGRFTIYWYAILMALGVAVAILLTDRRTKGRGLIKDIALDLCILGLPFGVLGARLFACLSGTVAWGDYFDLTKPGISFFGGVIVAALVLFVYLKLRKVDVGEMLDAAAPGVFAGIAISVWGDFFNRTHYGPLVEKASHKWFPLATFGDDLKIHYATFFYEFLLCVILIVVYYAFLCKLIRSKGDRFLLMALIYCLGRFCIDSIRDGLVMVGPLAFDQICEIVIAVLCLILLLLKRHPKEAEGENAETPKEVQPVEPEEKGEEAAAASVSESDPTSEPEPQPSLEPEPSPEPQSEKPFSGLS